MGPVRHWSIVLTGSVRVPLSEAIVPRVDTISTVPRGYCRNRLARPNSQACTKIAVQPEV